jgi:hypothetical protein
MLRELIRLDQATKAHKAALRQWAVNTGNTVSEFEGDRREYGPSTPKEEVDVVNPQKAVELGVAVWKKPRVTLRKKSA